MKTQMRRVFAAYYFAAAMFGFFGIPCLSFSQEASPDYIVSIRDWRHVVVRKNDHIYMDFSAEQHMKPDEWLDNDAGPLNPDGRYIPVLAARALGGGQEDIALLLVDVMNKHVERREMFHDVPAFMPIDTEWVTNRKIGFRSEVPPYYYLFDLDTSQTLMLEGENQIAWDSAGNHRASIYGKAEWSGKYIPPIRIRGAGLGVSQALKYDGYWVYPEPIRGWIDRGAYRQWRRDIAIREKGIGPKDEPIIRTRGVALEKNHVLSAPIFIGDTEWVGFFEQVFELGRWDKIIESNVVLLNAQRVKENPPRPENIIVKKKKVPSILPENEAEFVDLLSALWMKWNYSTKTLELWKSDVYPGYPASLASSIALRPRKSAELPEKIAEVAIDPSKMEMGDYKQSKPTAALNWSWFVKENHQKQ